MEEKQGRSSKRGEMKYGNNNDSSDNEDLVENGNNMNRSADADHYNKEDEIDEIREREEQSSENGSRSRSASRSDRRAKPSRGGGAGSRSRSRTPQSRSMSRSKSRTPPGMRKRKSSRSSRTPPRRRVKSRSSSSSSRDTYGSFKAASPTRTLGEFPCRKCDRTDFETVRELSEHQIRAHNARIPCAFCSKEASSVQKLVDHLKRRHVDLKLTCEYCKDVFGDRIADTSDTAWEEYRAHVYKECLKEKIYSNEKTKPKMDSFTMRGRGRCPHGPPVRCKNFPRCPGPKCYYFHGFCRYDTRCIKRDCPFDHTNRPRVCLSCIKDSRMPRERRSSRR